MVAAKASDEKVLGLICGSGKLPLLVAEAARADGRRVVAVAHKGETDEAIAAAADELSWVRLGQLGRIRDTLAAAGATEVCLAGGVTKVRFFRDARPDAVGLKMLAKLTTSRGDDRLLRAIASVFEDAGMHVVPATQVAPSLLAPEGPIGKRKPTRAQAADVVFGTRMARAVGRLDVGQAVVVREGVVLAVEATEGTDACIRRGAGQVEGGVVVVKVAKPGQDRRFDLPAVGPATIDVLAESGGGVLAVEAGSTLLLDREALVARADAARIPVVGVAPEPEPGQPGT